VWASRPRCEWTSLASRPFSGAKLSTLGYFPGLVDLEILGADSYTWLVDLQRRSKIVGLVDLTEMREAWWAS
jgi:hypothetical protein